MVESETSRERVPFKKKKKKKHCTKALHGLGVALPPPQFHRTHHLKVIDTVTVTSNVFFTVLSPREPWRLVTLLATPLLQRPHPGAIPVLVPHLPL